MQIPDYVVKNNKLSDSAKVLYGLILENSQDEICIKDNTFFSIQLGNVAERTVRRYLTELKNEGLIAQMNYQRIRNAIFILNKQDLNDVQKIKSIADFEISLSNLDKFVQNIDNFNSNEELMNPILSLFKDLYNLVLVSKENKNYINKSARTRETTFSKTNNVNKFSSYDNAGDNARVRTFDYKARNVYTNLLFKEFFSRLQAGPHYDVGIEIVDNMIEAFNQSQTEQGFVFNGVTYNSDKLLDIYLNITQDEFSKIVFSVYRNDEIKARSPYIMGSVINVGKALNWKKSYELVRQGCPWDYYVPERKEFKDLLFSVQQRVERERENQQLLREYQKTNSC